MAVSTPLHRRRPAPGLILAALVWVALLGCSAEPEATQLDQAVAREAATQAPDLVDLTLYFRHGRGPDAYLVPVVREVPVGAELARTALDLMLQGPTPGDPQGLHPPVPTTTAVRSFAVDGSTAMVDLSRHVIADANDVGKRPEHELLALAAIANTLTEFPQISRVAVTVEGQVEGAFWGGWGLPSVLVRDDSVIAPETSTPVVPALASFSKRAQEVGEPRRPRSVVSSVRIRPRATYVRISIELTDQAGADLVGPAPRTRAELRGSNILLSVGAEGSPGLAGAELIDDPAFRAASIDVTDVPPAVNVTIGRDRPAAFALQTLTDPTRIVLDIRR